MTLATICKSVAVRAGVAPVSAWAGNSNDTAREIVEFVAEATDMAVQAFDWQEMRRTYSVAITAATAQSVALPADFGRMIPNTAWINNASWLVRGPITEEEYEMIRQDLGGGGATPAYRLSAGALDLLAVPPPGGTLSLRYLTAYPILSSGGTPQRAWQADADTTLIDERVIVLAAVMLWRDSKGLPAQMAMAQYMGALGRLKATDNPTGIMSMAGRGPGGQSPYALADGRVVAIP